MQEFEDDDQGRYEYEVMRLRNIEEEIKKRKKAENSALWRSIRESLNRDFPSRPKPTKRQKLDYFKEQIFRQFVPGYVKNSANIDLVKHESNK